MASQVEARSLSTLNFLAAHPPQYPVNPTEKEQESLTLYISRVPGTRDVILSTFKPKLKNVSGADIANSLYYVHLDLPSDVHLASPPPIRGHGSPRSSGESARSPKAIMRKPLPSNSTVPKLENQTSVPTTKTTTVDERPSQLEPDVWIPPGFRLEQSPTLSDTTVPTVPTVPPNPPTRRPQSLQVQGSLPIYRKPLGPRPIDSPGTLRKDLPPPPPPPDLDTLFARPTPPSPGARRSNLHHGQTTSSPHTFAPVSTFRSPSPTKRESLPKLVPFSLTLIRRDPASGYQWNIGKVSSHQVETPEDGADPESQNQLTTGPRGHPTINIHLETSGYAKFRGFPMRRSLDNHRPSSSTSLPRSLLAGGSDDTVGKLEEGGFSRQVVMSYTKSWASNIRQAFRRRERSDSTDNPGVFELEPPRRPPGMHVRQDSVNSTASAESVMSGDGGHEAGESPPLITKPGPGLKPKGYVFTSPWDGRCEFRTGNGGRSVQCRHFLNNSNNNAVYNPLVLTQGIRDGQGLGHGRHRSISSAVTGAVPVSELRFNLPNSELFKPKRESRDLQMKFEKLINLDPRRGSTTDEEDEEPPPDLSLGKERAGGGNRGKRAKLGKLIIHDEGLKMLDLVVAANISIWWGAYEKSF